MCSQAARGAAAACVQPRACRAMHALRPLPACALPHASCAHACIHARAHGRRARPPSSRPPSGQAAPAEPGQARSARGSGEAGGAGAPEARGGQENRRVACPGTSARARSLQHARSCAHALQHARSCAHNPLPLQSRLAGLATASRSSLTRLRSSGRCCSRCAQHAARGASVLGHVLMYMGHVGARGWWAAGLLLQQGWMWGQGVGSHACSAHTRAHTRAHPFASASTSTHARSRSAARTRTHIAHARTDTRAHARTHTLSRPRAPAGRVPRD